MSADVIPVITYGINVPSLTYVVVIVKVIEAPSLTEAAERDRAYVGVLEPGEPLLNIGNPNI